VRTPLYFAGIRVAFIGLAVVLVAVHRDDLPSGWTTWAWILCAALAVQTAAIAVLRPRVARARLGAFDLAVLAVDGALAFAFVLVFSLTVGQPLRALFFIVVVEGALRFGRVGGVATALATGLLLLGAELWRAARFDFAFEVESIAIRLFVALALGFLVGRLTESHIAQRRLAESRAGEAERLRDELGRRVDVLEAANRCARALASSLDLGQAFGAFIRELQGLVPFERMAVVLAEDEMAQVMAVAGAGAETIFPAGSARPVRESVLEDVLAGRLVYREDMDDRRHPEEAELLALGLRCRVSAPLLLGPRAIGMLSVVRREPDSFAAEEVELISLLGRLVATAVQNIRAYESERRTVEELRRLSALRADFVSLVSHELRSPMAAVIGSARTLQQRWRELSQDQRDSFLALIAEETGRLARLVSDVLDTSRIEAGTFSYQFEDVDVGELVQDTVASVSVGQDEVRVVASIRSPLPPVRADGARLGQVLRNLVDNAVKYSPDGSEVKVSAYAHRDQVFVDVVDAGPGIQREHQRLIFEKFGRTKTDGAKPGTGLGLFIARSIAEAHGGSLDVRSSPERGSIFTLTLPAGP
jgi:K+-sensing histidine kinase KdpD